MGRITKDYPLKAFYSDIYTSYDRVNRIFTFGRDLAWRRKAATACLEGNPVKVLDVCTGTGDFILEIARRTGGNSLLTGYDYSSEMLKVARKKHLVLKEKEGVTAVEFVEGDVGSMPFEENLFDAMGITFGIRNLVYENSRATEHLSEMHRVLRPGGRLVILESSNPDNSFWRFINSLYLQLVLPYLGGLISGNLKAYKYLASSSKNYYSMGEMGSILEEAGFRISKSQPLFMGSVMMVVAVKK